MVQDYLPTLLHGAWLSLEVALASLLLAVVFGLANALVKLFGSGWLRALSVAYTTAIRGVPELVMMLFLFYGGERITNIVVGALGGPQIDFNKFAAGVVTIGFVYGAYFTETFRGAFLAVPRGELEAGMAYGMSGWQTFRFILLPRMIPFALPSANNNWLGLMKASALVSILGLQDMAWVAEQAGRATQKPFLFYLLVCLAYLAITTLSGGCVRSLQKRYELEGRRI
ncbi:ABC transporter permease [Paraburkholderia antibiotica]|uniref:ABC transporter permease subunit n=1 Tax=Paraburkholderia antibiotica TaxID=2728839 RepID=A0A7Y0A0V2_9BURK|nr:ABC transporter permease subunit [Paraburkholderia antibiotica]NML34448.1 ABC transporter permease subunit [Paraburkholderia antibiotica]